MLNDSAGRLVLILGTVILAALLVAGWQGCLESSFVQSAVLTITAAIVLWYTVETSRLRREMVRQNDISLRPIVLPEFKGPGRQFMLKNCGVGCALNVRVSPIQLPPELTEPLAAGNCEIRFRPPYYMEAGEQLAIPFTVWANGERMAVSPYAEWFFPDRVTRRITFSITFEDVEGRSYEIPVTLEGEPDPARGPRPSARVEIGAIRHVAESKKQKPKQSNS